MEIIMDLITYIKCINFKAQLHMNQNSDSWIGLFTTDRKHWNDYGIFCVRDFKTYIGV